MSSMGLADRIFLFYESNDSPQHVGGMAIFRLPDGAPDGYVRDLAKRHTQARSFVAPYNYRLRHPKLKSVRPTLDEVPDGEFDLDYHFRHAALPAPGGELELGELVSWLHSRPLDLSKPLWECHLIEGLENNRFAVYYKIHHALTDGIGAMRRLAQMLSEDPSDSALRPLWSIETTASAGRETAPRDDLLEGPHSGARGALAGAVGLGKVVSKMIVDGVRGTDPADATPYKVPQTRLNGRIGQQRRVATQSVELARVKEVCARAGVTVNDVFLGLCSAALRRYLRELGDLPERGLITGTPVSIRVGTGDTSNNAFTVVAMNLYTDIADPVERLKAINRSSTAAKRNLQGVSKSVAEGYGALLTVPFVLQQLVGLGGRVPPPYNIVISNVPGTPRPQYLAGARLEALYPFGLAYHGIALFIASVTTAGNMCLGFSSDRDSVPHMQRIAVYVGEALVELEKALAHVDPVRRDRVRSDPKE